MAVAAKKVVAKPTYVKFSLDCKDAQADNLIDVSCLSQFFHDKIKIDGKTGNFEKHNAFTGETTRFCTITRDSDVITIEAKLPFPKRYVKFLTKKYLRAHQVRDFLRVVATGKNDYAIRYFKPVKQAMDN